MHSFEVHSNESACRKKVLLGLEQVKKVRSTHTFQYAVKGVGFFKNGIQLKRKSPLNIIPTEDRVNLKITNKNGQMGETITHETVLDIEYGPVQAMHLRINAIMYNGDNEENILSDYVSTEGIRTTITSTQIRTLVRAAVRIINLEKKVISFELVGVHSLRLG